VYRVVLPFDPYEMVFGRGESVIVDNLFKTLEYNAAVLNEIESVPHTVPTRHILDSN
jgi:hypothetical protein